MKKRVLVGGLHHESDTFNPIITSRDDIWVLRGDDLLNNRSDNSVSGAIDTLLKAGYEVIPTLVARAVPNGEWDKEYYEELRDEIIEGVKKALPLDAICLSLHGSMRVKDLGEAEGDLLERIRALCPNTPIITSLDMHATVSKRMLDNANGFVGYKCAPHTDTFLTGQHAARMVIDTLEHGAKPVIGSVSIPFLVAGEQSETSVEPMKSITQYLREVEKREGVMAASILLGFPWADSGENSVTALVVTDNNPQLAKDLAKEIASLFWSKRFDFKFYTETHEPDEALEKAKESIKDGVYPVVISDSGDNPTAGSSGDVTTFLKSIIADKALSALKPAVIYQAIYDKEVVKEAFNVGVGNNVKEKLGASFDSVKSTPIDINAKVLALKKEWITGEEKIDLALLDVEGVEVVVTNKHAGCYDPLMMEALGVVPEERKLIIVKLGYLEPEIRAISKRSIMALTTGSSNEVFSRLPYKNLPHPIFPLDGDFSYNPE